MALEELQGTVEHIVFRNEQNGWTVLDLSAEGELHKVVGILPAAYAGEFLRLRGHFCRQETFLDKKRKLWYTAGKRRFVPKDAAGTE